MRETAKVAGWLLLLEIAFGCARGVLAPPARVGDANTMVLSHVVFPVPAVWWTQSRWYDVYHDTGTPSRVLIAGQWACVEYDLGVVEPRAGRAYKCATRWRSGPHAK